MKILDKEVNEGDIVFIEDVKGRHFVGFVKVNGINLIDKGLYAVLGHDVVLTHSRKSLNLAYSLRSEKIKVLEVLKEFVKKEVKNSFEKESENVQKLIEDVEEQIDAESKGKTEIATLGNEDINGKSDDKPQEEVKKVE